MELIHIRQGDLNPLGNPSPMKQESQVAQEPEGDKAPTVEHPGGWETSMGWVYIGHGEWIPSEDTNPITYKSQVAQEPEWVYKWLCKTDEDIKLHDQVNTEGYPNIWGARRPVKTKWNLKLFGSLLRDYEDKEVVEWMRYGWPTGRLPTLPNPGTSGKNHKGAEEHPKALQKYIEKEQTHGAVMGPFNKIPFQNKIGISPLSTRPKKDTEERRIILDLSFPIGE